MATLRAPKQWCLSKSESINSFENWRQNLLYTLSLDANFAPYLAEDCTWLKKTKSAPLRGFADDADSVPAARRRTAQQKTTMLELMLGQVANYCPIISRNTIVKNSTSIESIWSAIRLHFGFQATGAHFVDFDDIKLQPNERPEDLYQRLMAFVEDNLLHANATLTHHDEQVTDDEELTPSLENFVVLTWLRLINPALPKLVKQRYGTELRSRTLASIKPEISQALSSLLDELTSCDEARIMRTDTQPLRQRRNKFPPRPPLQQSRVPSPREKSCPLCKQASRPSNHFLSECRFLPDSDRRYMARARQIAAILESEEESGDDSPPESFPCPEDNPPTHVSRLVQVSQSPYIDAFHHHNTVRITIDSGATCNMIRLATVKRLGATIKPTTQSARQADGHSTLDVVGETVITLSREDHQLHFEGLVVENLDVEILAGTPFMEDNDIAVRPATREVSVHGSPYLYSPPNNKPPQRTARRAVVLRAPPSSTTVWPGEFLELTLPKDIPTDSEYALEPRTDTSPSQSSKMSNLWPFPNIVSSVAGRIRIPNLSDQPCYLRRNEHFCQINHVFTPPDVPGPPLAPRAASIPKPIPDNHLFSSSVKVDPANLLPSDIRRQFHEALTRFDGVFNPHFKGYNGASGPFEAKVNMGPVEPPQRKGRLPQYSRDKLVQLQSKFDELEDQGVFKRPEDLGISVEYLNPSFLVGKPNGGSRLVTAFGEVGRYSKPQPSLMPDVDSTLRLVGQWKHIITTDLTSAFYQIPLARESMKYCGVVTPFRGTRVYVRTAMGMPGSETALEELMCRVLGDLLTEGVVAKIADDLYCGGNTPLELLNNWIKVLNALEKNSLHLSPTKTIINPHTTTILGWIWSQGTLSASPHRISALSASSPPKKVSELKSFIGAYKVLSRVIPGCSALISPLDDAVAGLPSTHAINWTDQLHDAFNTAKDALSNSRSITIPRPTDLLWIVTDGAVRKPGIASTLYVTRSDQLHLAGFFSAKLRSHQSQWLPCEVEALAIASSVKHFSPFIIQSTNTARVLTDSKPCVQAHEKLCRGEFSASPRVSTFLSTVCRYQVHVQHVAGAAILPSDFASRNAPECDDMACQVCTFINTAQSSVIRRTNANDVIQGNAHLPFTSRAAWLSIQSDCPDLRRTHAHLKQGTRPSKKTTNIRDVKRYLNVVKIARDGLLVVQRNEPLLPSRECIVVPRQVLDGLLTALHLRLSHPSAHQLKLATRRYFFALDIDKSIDRITSGCHMCASLKKKPHTVVDQSTSSPPEAIGLSFASDVIKRNRQLILVLRECVTSFTASTLIEDERHESLRSALIRLCIELRPLDGPPAIIRTDPASGFKTLIDDKLLQHHRISIEIGRIKNTNKNPVAERAVQELEAELLRLNPLGGTVSPLDLSIATATLNARIRSRGLSSREMWFQRDQFSNMQLPLDDRDLIIQQNEIRLRNHPHSERSKAPLGGIAESPTVSVGDLIYLHSDRNKTVARDRYLVVSLEGNWCNVKKFRGTQLRNASYRVKRSECYKVPSTLDLPTSNASLSVPSDDEDDAVPTPPVQAPPPYPPLDIPWEISVPSSTPESFPSHPPLEQEPTEASSDSHSSTTVCDPPCESTMPPSNDQSRRSSRSRSRPSYLADYVT